MNCWIVHLLKAPRRFRAPRRAAHSRAREISIYSATTTPGAEAIERELAAILMPPHALPAFHHGHSADLLLAACYAYWANLLEMPAGTVPVSQINQNESLTQRDVGWDVAKRTARKAERGSEGLPLGVQVVAPHWREDIVLAVMYAIENEIEFRISCPELPNARAKR